MVVIPKQQPVLENLNVYYLNIRKLLEHFQGEIGTGHRAGAAAGQGPLAQENRGRPLLPGADGGTEAGAAPSHHKYFHIVTLLEECGNPGSICELQRIEIEVLATLVIDPTLYK